MAENYILFDVKPSGVATLTLNRPEKYNAFTPEMIDQWFEVLAKAADDPAVRVVVLTGAGKAFCAGGDAGKMEHRATQDALTQKHFLWRQVHKIPLLLEQLDKPIIAAINGVARGAGLDMALMCDIRFMAESANVGESYINLGLIAGDGGAYYLPKLIGMDKALEIFWTGRSVGAKEAEQLGMVTRAVPDDQLMAVTYELAERIAAQPFEAVRAYKRLTYQSRNLSLTAHLDMVSSHTAILRDTDDHRQRIAAVAAKRAKT